MAHLRPFPLSLLPHRGWRMKNTAFFRRFWATCLGLTVMLMATYAYSRVPEETHVVLQKLAQVEYQEFRLAKIGLSIKIPQNWTNRPGNQGGLAYFDTYYPDVIGSIFSIPNAASESTLLNALETRFVTSWAVIETKTLETSSGIRLDLYQLQGRIVGEETLLLVGAFSLTSDETVLIIASAPETWYRSYEPVFIDILKSVSRL